MYRYIKKPPGGGFFDIFDMVYLCKHTEQTATDNVGKQIRISVYLVCVHHDFALYGKESAVL